LSPALEVKRAIFNAYTSNVRELDSDVLRLERRFGDKIFAIAYVDLSDSVVDRAKTLRNFQEGLLGEDFFNGESDLRWNSYLYFWAGPHSIQSSEFNQAKATIERDRHFARKFVVTEQELLQRLDGSARPVESEKPMLTDVSEVWGSSLRAASLGVVLEQRARTITLEAILDGTAFRAEPSSGSSGPMAVSRDALGDGKLRELSIGAFRKVHRGKRFEFADVNLIVGANGKGKTSLLEAIEALYCGRVRRDSKATFQEIVGKVRMPDGMFETVKATTAVGTAKARNAAWYGRTDTQASAILQGFTRFNFLDTDAAFRLSAEESSEQIKLDLSRLLVGAETSKLWNHISNLEREASDRLRTTRERLPAERRQVELLTAEVARLKSLPSQATVTLQTLKSRMTELGTVAPISDDALLSAGTRSMLAEIQKYLSGALAGSSNTELTKGDLEQSRRQLQTLSEQVLRLATDEDVHISAAEHASRSLEERRASTAALERWSALVAANVPAQARATQELQKAVADLRNALTVAVPPTDVSDEYRSVPLHEAASISRAKTSQAVESERAASAALAQQQRLGERLSALRADLSAVSKSYLEQSGDEERCPVCGTTHGPGELMAKLELMLGSSDSSTVVALRQSLQFAREEVAKARADEEGLGSIGVLAKSLRIDTNLNVATVLETVGSARNQLDSHQTALEAARAHLAQVAASGVIWSDWQAVLKEVSSLLTEEEAEDPTLIGRALESAREELQRLQEKRLGALESLEAIRIEVAFLTKGAIANAGTAKETLALIKRTEVSLADVNEALSQVTSHIQVRQDEPLRLVLARVDNVVLAADRALLAKSAEEQAASELKAKETELATATRRLRGGDKARENLERAVAVLSELVVKHSLEQATSDAFRSIRDRVGSVFAQIHSPPEYELGSFDDELGFLIRKDDGVRHALDQVSTGQRAALALSIFLASNASARSAPPVLLIDDPVAHIDDLNALSLLDYLRELALCADKQIFFATADIRLAALFERKFEFLGNERFRKVSLA
jgi:chromosome segregation protein